MNAATVVNLEKFWKLLSSTVIIIIISTVNSKKKYELYVRVWEGGGEGRWTGAVSKLLDNSILRPQLQFLHYSQVFAGSMKFRCVLFYTLDKICKYLYTSWWFRRLPTDSSSVSDFYLYCLAIRSILQIWYTNFFTCKLIYFWIWINRSSHTTSRKVFLFFNFS